jgi:hypothetical protein
MSIEYIGPAEVVLSRTKLEAKNLMIPLLENTEYVFK